MEQLVPYLWSMSFITLLIAFQVKHWLCDYPLQIPYMLGKFKPFPDFVMPLLAHAAVHGAGTMVICAMLDLPLRAPLLVIQVCMFDMVCHFVIDFLKANPAVGGRWKALSGNEMKEVMAIVNDPLALKGKREHAKWQLEQNKYFWWALGADQTMHHFTHYAIIVYLMNAGVLA